ncbi:MAG TPA: hypothetical protein VJ815_09560 [Acidimicrobiia bacterium]|nr:hypothetical protein [Acidimicrobiia bacterium]
MTDTLTRPSPEVEKREVPTPAKKVRVSILGLFIAALLGLVLFAITGRPNRSELEQTRWDQVVDYYTDQYQVMAETRSRVEAARWQDVVNHYARQYELIAGSAQQAPRDEAAHWQAVVNHYEQQWELTSK